MIKFSDAAAVGRTKKTKEGYLVATSKVARTGIQKYRASELGDIAIAAGFDPSDIVSVYRHEDQVFSDAMRNGLTRIPVTVDHPPVMVDADNWSQYSVGEVGDIVTRDGDWWVVNPMIKDSSAEIKAKTTHRQLSLGYTAEIVAARDGIDADFEMVNMQPNHLSMVPAGRAGEQARIGDADHWGASPVTVKDKEMTVEMKAVVLGDKAVQVEAKDADTVKAAFDALEVKLDLKDAEIKTLKDAVLTDAQIAALVDAKIELNKKRDAVVAKIGDKAKDFNDAKIEMAFELLDHVEAPADESARAAIGDVAVVNDHDAKIKAAQNKFLYPENK